MNITIKVKPGAKRDEIISYEKQDDSNYILKLSVKQVPENGKANKAVIKLLAKEFGLKQNDVEIISGVGSSCKIVKLNCTNILINSIISLNQKKG
jgi:uncharacterized protein (TIGR00251 family)